MRKLTFTLKSFGPKQFMRNVEISTHLGARLLVKVNETTVLPIAEEEEMSDNELLNWYRSRYSTTGIGVGIIRDQAKVEAAKSEVTAVEVKSVVEEKVPEKEPEKELSKSVVRRLAVQKEKENPVSKMSYSEMVKFAKEHDIEVGGRAKELYVKALNLWFKEHGE